MDRISRPTRCNKSLHCLSLRSIPPKPSSKFPAWKLNTVAPWLSEHDIGHDQLRAWRHGSDRMPQNSKTSAIAPVVEDVSREVGMRALSISTASGCTVSLHTSDRLRVEDIIGPYNQRHAYSLDL